MDDRLPGLGKWPTVRVRQIVVFVGVAVVALVVLTVGQPLGLATSRQHEHYAELYFTDPSGATVVTDGQAMVSFTVHNSAGRAIAYPYTVAVDGKAELSTTTPVVPAGQRYTGQSRVQLPTGSKPVELSVTLTSGQRIHTWIDRGKS